MRPKKAWVVALVVGCAVCLRAWQPVWAAEIFAWGNNDFGQIDAPAGNYFVAVAAGDAFSLALKADGWIVGWGAGEVNTGDWPHYGQANPPAGNGFTAIAAGQDHSLALKADGSIVGWGYNGFYGLIEVPAGNDFVAIAAGANHSLALTTNRAIVAWGQNTWGQTNAPSGDDFAAIAAGTALSLALKADGSIVAWGYDDYGASGVPAGNDFIAIATSNQHCLALKEDGSIVTWGFIEFGGLSDVPAGNDFVAIATGCGYSLALKADGSLVAWGNWYGDLPAGNNFIAIAGGCRHALALWEPPCDLSGRVYDIETGDPVAGATVSASEEAVTQTNAQGEFSLSELPCGQMTVSVTKAETGADYSEATEAVTTTLASQTTMNIPLTPVEGFEVAEVRGRYCGPGKHVYYLDGISLEETFTATINWSSHEPGYVRWDTPGGVYDDTCPGTTVARSFNMDSDFGENGQMTVIAVSGDDPPVESEPYVTNFKVIPLPPGLSSEGWMVQASNQLKYVQAVQEVSLPMEGVGGGAIPDWVPIFGGEPYQVGIGFKLSPEVQGDGTGTAGMGKLSTGGSAPSQFGGGDWEFSIGGKATWKYDGTTWQPGGSLEIGLNASKNLPSKPKYVIVWVWIIPIPLYWQGKVGVDSEASIGFEDWTADPLLPTLNGQFTVKPNAGIRGGVGAADVAAVEGNLVGYAPLVLQYPAEPTLKSVSVGLTGSLKLVVWKYTQEWPVLDYKWDLYTGGTDPLADKLRGWDDWSEFSLLPRDYMGAHYAEFNPDGVPTSPRESPSRGTESTLQTNVFPYLAPSLVAVGDDARLLWLYDDPERTNINGTEVVFSASSNGLWSPPVAVADDGTADFAPVLAAQPAGGLLAAWENANAVLPDETDLETMSSHMEIAAAGFDAVTQTWSSQINLTSNGYLDRSPRLSVGSNGLAMLTWVSNASNHPMGSTTEPNTVHYCLWDGVSWSVPGVVVAAVPSIVKSAMAFDGSGALYLYSADTDDNLETQEDRELYTVSFDGATWSSPRRLTNDPDVLDANPQVVAIGPGQFLFAWFRGEEIVTAGRMDLYECEPTTSVTYNILREDLINVPDDCGSGPYGTGTLGFTWMDTGDGPVAEVQIEFNVGIECHWDTVHTTALNGIADASYASTSYYCSCDPTDGVQAHISANPANYNVGGLNTFQITNCTTDLGFTPHAAWGSEVYARVTVVSFGRDCNENGISDHCDMAIGTSEDCNSNGVPDECDIADGTSADGNTNGVPDECDLAGGNSVDLTVAVSPGLNAGAMDFRLVRSGTGQVALVWQMPSQEAVDVWQSLYNPDLSVWSRPVQLTFNDAMERSMSPAYLASGDLLIAYGKEAVSYETRTLVIGDEEIVLDNVPVPGQTDLCVLRHTAGIDLAISADDITFSPENPAGGQTATITATVHNVGDLPATDVEVAFYDGDPDAGGTQIWWTPTIAGPLVGGDEAAVSVYWEVSSSSEPHDIYVVIDPDSMQGDYNRTNNMAIVAGVMKPDLRIDSILVQNAGQADRIITVRVANAGALAVSNVEVTLRANAVDGDLLTTFAIAGPIAPRAYDDAFWIWEDAAPFLEGSVDVFAIADEADAIDEFDEDNNVRRAVLRNDEVASDCNLNGYDDASDIAAGTSEDYNTNGIPDECEPAFGQILLRTGEEPGVLCVGTEDTFTVTLEVADLDYAINGVQALIHYDAAHLALVSITPAPNWVLITPDGADPDPDGDGDLTCALYLPGGEMSADGVVATLLFDPAAEGATSVTFRSDDPPFHTKLTRAYDNTTIIPGKVDSGTISIDDTVATATSNGPTFCEGDTIELYGGPSSGPLGPYTYAWTGPDGFSSTEQSPMISDATLAMTGTYYLTVTNVNGCEFTAQTDVEVYLCMVVNVEIEGLIGDDPGGYGLPSSDGSAIDREVTFVFTDCDGATGTHIIPITFTADTFNNKGVGSVRFEDLDAGFEWLGVQEGHTLGKRVAVDFVTTLPDSVTVFLTSGDFHTTFVPQDNLVDITDFSILASNWETAIDADQSIVGDATGDGYHDGDDFALIQPNFFEVGDTVNGCGRVGRVSPAALHVDVVSRTPRAGISVSELSLTVAHADRADLDGNGVVNARDIRAFARRHNLPLQPAFDAKLLELEAQLTDLEPVLQPAMELEVTPQRSR